MAGGLVKYRHLSRGSAHRRALLRNLVTALVQHESIHTTYAKAKETQRLAEKLITLAKRNNETSRRKAQGILFTPDALLPKLFGELRQRYEARPGGYTRVLRTEPKSTYDQGESAVLQLVDGPKDLRWATAAAAVARDRRLGRPQTALTRLNRRKATRFRAGGGPAAQAAFEALVGRMADLRLEVAGGRDPVPKKPGRASSSPLASAIARGGRAGGSYSSGASRSQSQSQSQNKALTVAAAAARGKARARDNDSSASASR